MQITPCGLHICISITHHKIKCTMLKSFVKLILEVICKCIDWVENLDWKYLCQLKLHHARNNYILLSWSRIWTTNASFKKLHLSTMEGYLMIWHPSFSLRTIGPMTQEVYMFRLLNKKQDINLINLKSVFPWYS